LMWPSVDSSFSSLSYSSMHEPAKAVIVLALSTAVAVWLLGVALHLWPDTGQLAYGNPLPYLKVKFDRPANAVKFWVEDFNGLQYERVWLYVNGRLAASGGPSTNTTAMCGDEVAAVVKYHSGTKKLEGRIFCTKPIKPPGGQVTQLTTTNEAIETALDSYEPAARRTGVPIALSGECTYDGYSFTGKVYLRVLRSDVFLTTTNVWLQNYVFRLSGTETKALTFRLGKIGTSPFTSFAAFTKEYYVVWAEGIYEERVLYKIYPDGEVVEKKYYVYGGGTGLSLQLLAFCHAVEERRTVEVYNTGQKELPSNATVNYKAVLTIRYADGTEEKIGLAGLVEIWAYGDTVGAKITKVRLSGENINLKDPWESLRIELYDVQTNEKTGEIIITRTMTMQQHTNLYEFLFRSDDIKNVFRAYLTNRCGQNGYIDFACMTDFYLNDLLGIPDRPIQQLLYGKIPYATYTYSALVTSSYVSRFTSVGYSTVGFLGVPDPTSLGLYFYTSPTLPIKIPTAKTPTSLPLSNNQTEVPSAGTSTGTTSIQCIIDGKPAQCIYGVGDLLTITKT
jgi:hypothetical protein